MTDQKNEIAALDKELLLMKEERDRMNLEAKKWVNKRNALNEKVKNMRKDASEIKEQRDALNNQVQQLKKMRDQLNAQGKGKSNQILTLQKKINKLNENKPQGNMRQVAKQIEEIDWKIQTNSLSVKEEQELVNQIRQLEIQLFDQKRIEKVKDQLFEIRNEQKSLGTEAKTIHEKMFELAEKSQKLHTQMLSILNKASEQQAAADEAHKKYVEVKQLALQKHEKCVELVGKIKAIQQELRETTDKKQIIRQGELKEELEKRALTKMKSGEKLLWEEFQILAEKGLL
jgi:uncharacterized coiled-coil DUF342 family protein